MSLPNLKEPKILSKVKSGMVFAGDDDTGEITILKEDLDEILQWVDERLKRLHLRREHAQIEIGKIEHICEKGGFKLDLYPDYREWRGRLIELNEQLGETDK